VAKTLKSNEDGEERERIPFAKPYFGDDLNRQRMLDKIADILYEPSGERGKVSNGENCRKLEEEVCRIHGADRAFVCSSCTQGMMLMLGACGANGLCQTQSFTWPSTVIAANVQGSQIVPHDIDYEHWAVMHYPTHHKKSYALAVDTFGCDARPTSDVPLFYDRAHSLGVRFKHIGLASAISFSPSKLLTAGEGGAVLTNSARFVEAIAEARNMTSRLSEFSAIVALEGLKNIDALLEWKKETYEHYKRAFPMFEFQGGSGNHQVIGMLMESGEQRDRLMKALNDEIEFKAYYVPVHRKYQARVKLDLPITEDVANRILCLPSWFGVDRDYIIDRIKGVLNL
jgi:dTDP-4-amino-4,6-dideoxygalactose transaminase